MFDYIFDLDRTLWDPGQLCQLINGVIAVAARRARVPDECIRVVMEAAQHRGFAGRVMKFECLTTPQKEALIAAHRSLKAPAYIKTYGDEHLIELLTGKKFLATRGNGRFQSSKITMLGVSRLFVEMHIVQDSKLSTYEDILRRHALDPGRVIVVGDHPGDLMPAYELGMIPVHMIRPGTQTIRAMYQVADIKGLIALEAWLMRAFSRHSP